MEEKRKRNSSKLLFSQIRINDNKTIKILKDILEEKEKGNKLDEHIFQLPEIFTIIRMILTKYQKDENDIYVISHYLLSLKSFISSILEGQPFDFDIMPLLRKIAHDLYCEEFKKNEFMMKVGDIGKTFYVILSGSISIIVPKTITVKMTKDQYIYHLKLLHQLGENYLLEKTYYNNLGELPYLKLEHITKENKIHHKRIKSSIQKIHNKKRDLYKQFKRENKITKSFELKKTDIEEMILPKDELISKRKSVVFKLRKTLYDIHRENLEEKHRKSIEFVRRNSAEDNIVKVIEGQTIENNEEEKKTQKVKKKEHIKEDKEFSLENYIKLINAEYINIDKTQYTYDIKLLGYFKVTDLYQGSAFGELALLNENNQRTATIFVKEHSYFGVLTSSSYQKSLKHIQEINKKKDVHFVFNTKLFKEISFFNFGIKYWNFFINRKLLLDDYLFKQGQERDEIYFIQEGEFLLITNNLSIRKLNLYLMEIGNFKFKKRELLNVGKEIDVPLIYAKKGDILGMSDLLYKGNFICDAICTSKRASIFAININIFKNIYKNYPSALNNWKKLELHKKVLMIQRFQKINFCNKNSLYGEFRNDEENIIYWNKRYGIEEVKKDEKKYNNIKNYHTEIQSFDLERERSKTLINISKSKTINLKKTKLPFINPFQEYQKYSLKKYNLRNHFYSTTNTNYNNTFTTEYSLNKSSKINMKSQNEDIIINKKRDLAFLELKKNVLKNNKQDFITKSILGNNLEDYNKNNDDFYFFNPEDENHLLGNKLKISKKKPKPITFFNKGRNAGRKNFLLTEINDVKGKEKGKTQFPSYFGFMKN